MAADMKEKAAKMQENLKKGFQDIQTVAQEGNVKLFVKQFVAVLVVFLLLRYANGKFDDKVRNFNGQVDAIRVQQTSEQEYQANKTKLLSLEPKFPNIESKNEWLLSQILGIFKTANITPQIEGQQTEDTSNSTFVAASLRVNTEMGFTPFAEFLAGIENLDEYIKVTEFSIAKQQEASKLGVNKVSMRFNTIFPKEKIAKGLFKDYDKIIQEQQTQKSSKRKGGKK
ncbi:MAG: hypothetical protein EGQ14_01815 [Spirochaetia bacterium]|uniref:hypothetical protein n=1 Tax=Candidatus Avelusimicrobium fimicolum TaxID=3416216 RepID=UPI003CA1A9CB|nr:hypothetical protein [Spirochaetia bacterium]